MNQPVQITVRTKPSGGPVADAVSESDGHLSGNSRVLILIHGYDDSFSDALGFYTTFLKSLAADFPTYLGQPAEFFWPGDSEIPGLSALSFPAEIGPAKESAQKLATYLLTLRGAQNGPVQLDLVGHSLGCRVIIEVLKIWAGPGGMPANIQLNTVSLMAAAVVVKQVDQEGDARAAAILAGNSLILYSKGDPVLHFAFPPGETLAGDAFFPTAVGRFGGPAQTWKQTLQMVTAAGKLYVHGSYWPGDESANAVATALGGAPARNLAQNAIVESLAPAANSISARSTPVRTLPAQPAFA